MSRGFTDRRAVSEGVGDHLGSRSAPTTMNAALFQTMFWDGRATTLEDQAKLPILNPIEMGHPDGAAVVKALETDPTYVGFFQKAYGRAPNLSGRRPRHRELRAHPVLRVGCEM